LFFIEIVSNQHNDLWMLVPSLAALLLVFSKPKRQAWLKIVLSALLLLFSVSTKLATLALVPLWLIAITGWYWSKVRQIFSWEKLIFLSSLLLFLPLLTPRSQQFLPWYLTWSLVWLPFINNRWWRAWVIGFSLTAMLRYLPWLSAGEFTKPVLYQQKLIVWGGGLLLWLAYFIWSKLGRLGYNKSG
jgi:hypothetical protein